VTTLPAVEYARNGAVSIAFQVFGDGPSLLVIPGWASHLERNWDLPGFADLLGRLSEFARVVIVDRRGAGLSDRFSADDLPTLEDHVGDVRAVLRQVAVSHATVLGMEDSSMLACVFAAAHPDVVTSLVLYAPRASGRKAADYPWAADTEEWDWYLERVREGWGTDPYAQLDARVAVPSAAGRPDAVAEWARYLRNAASPASARALIRQFSETDVRDVLSSVRIPTTLIRHRDDALVPRAVVEYIAGRVEGARIVEVDGKDSVAWFAGDMAGVASAVAEAVTGATPATSGDRRLATVLFTDIVDATARAAALGDHAWRAVVERHHDVIRSELRKFQGLEVDTAGDGFFATFDGPARAVRCAEACIRTAGDLGLELRAGVHTGEVETVDGKAGGLAVHIGARIGALAGASEVIASQTVKDLVAGSGLSFEDLGEHELKGVPDRWRLYRVIG
jgi:class 3 adenylate cyclase